MRENDRRRHHPLLFAIGALIVLGVVGAAGYAAWNLYSDAAWRASARESAEAVAVAVQTHSERTGRPPTPVDAVAAGAEDDQVAIEDLPYADEVPSSVSRFRISPDGALSVLTTSEALCSGVAVDLEEVGAEPNGTFTCGDALMPQAPVGLAATARDESVLLNWSLPTTPVEDYVVSLSANGGTSWTLVPRTPSARTEAIVQSLVNGREYLFTVTAQNLMGESPPASTRATPFSRPGMPVDVQAQGGKSAVVTWRPPASDGGRPISGYLVTGSPYGTCQVPATETSCELEELPGASGYTFIVRAINEAGLGEANDPAAGPVAIYSPPGPPVAILTSPGDRVVLLTWTSPLRDGNTPITDYRVEYRAVGSEEWLTLQRPPSTDTAAAVPGLLNGTTYQFRVRAINDAGESVAPVSTPEETPATVPGMVGEVTRAPGDEVVALSWTPPQDDGSAEVTDYAIEYQRADDLAAGDAWQEFDDDPSATTTRDVTGLVNGTRYAFRVAAVNRIGVGPWSAPVVGKPIGPPGAVRKPKSVGTLTAIELTWKAPDNDGGRPLIGYRIDYRVTGETDWIRSGRVPADVTTWTVENLEGGESYDFRIVAINDVGVGPANPVDTVDTEGIADTEASTLAGVIADETPPAPESFTAVPGDRQVSFTWAASPAGRKSPITAYTVTGEPTGQCVTKELSCVIRGLTNGVRYTFRITAENENIVGKPSPRVSVVPMAFNAATGGTVTTYERDGRTYRVHTFTTGGLFTVTAAQQPFSVLVVGGGGGSAQAQGGPLYPGGGGGVIDAPQITLPTGGLNVAVGAGGPPGLAGGPTLLDAVGTAPGGAAGAATLAEFSAPVRSDISGKRRLYGKSGAVDSGQGRDGKGFGGGGPTVNRGGAGIVIISYEISPVGTAD